MRTAASLSDVPFERRSVYMGAFIVVAVVLLVWCGQIQYDNWVMEQQKVTVDWNGDKLVFSVPDLQHRYIITHLVDVRFGEIAALDRPLLLYGSATMTRQQVAKLDWRVMVSGIYMSKEVVAGDKVAAPDSLFSMRAFYYQAQTSGWANNR